MYLKYRRGSQNERSKMQWTTLCRENCDTEFSEVEAILPVFNWIKNQDSCAAACHWSKVTYDSYDMNHIRRTHSAIRFTTYLVPSYELKDLFQQRRASRIYESDYTFSTHYYGLMIEAVIEAPVETTNIFWIFNGYSFTQIADFTQISQKALRKKPGLLN